MNFKKIAEEIIDFINDQEFEYEHGYAKKAIIQSLRQAWLEGARNMQEEVNKAVKGLGKFNINPETLMEEEK